MLRSRSCMVARRHMQAYMQTRQVNEANACMLGSHSTSPCLFVCLFVCLRMHMCVCVCLTQVCVRVYVCVCVTHLLVCGLQLAMSPHQHLRRHGRERPP